MTNKAACQPQPGWRCVLSFPPTTSRHSSPLRPLPRPAVPRPEHSPSLHRRHPRSRPALPCPHFTSLPHPRIMSDRFPQYHQMIPNFSNPALLQQQQQQQQHPQQSQHPQHQQQPDQHAAYQDQNRLWQQQAQFRPRSGMDINQQPQQQQQQQPQQVSLSQPHLPSPPLSLPHTSLLPYPAATNPFLVVGASSS